MMASFETGFAARHEDAFAAICAALPFDYFGIDCAEAPDGRLLLFEADVAMFVHAMHDRVLFAYKDAPMARLFAAFRDLLGAAAG